MNREINWREISIIIKSILRDQNKEDYQQYLDRRTIVHLNLISKIREINVQEYHILNNVSFDPNSGMNKAFIQFRFLTNDNITKKIINYLQVMKNQNRIDAFTKPKSYDPHSDSQKRFEVTSMMKNMGLIFENPQVNIANFEVMLRKTVKKCVEKFLEDFPSPPRDIWVMSVFLHLFLNSLGYTSFKEQAIRGFPIM